jgi:hypothetical protein
MYLRIEKHFPNYEFKISGPDTHTLPAVPQFMSLVAGFLPWWPRFEPKSDHGICGGQIRQVLCATNSNSTHRSKFVNQPTINAIQS